MKIHILGAAGAGTTTLGIALSKILEIKQFDSDDYFWEKTNPPFQVKRKSSDRTELLKNDLDNLESWIVSGSAMGWGDFLLEITDWFIYIYLENKVRIERLKNREYERYGVKINEGNEMYVQHLEFLEWANQYESGGMDIRSKKSHAEWLRNVQNKVIRISSMMKIDDEVKYCIEKMKGITPSPSWLRRNVY